MASLPPWGKGSENCEGRMSKHRHANGQPSSKRKTDAHMHIQR